MAFFHILFRRMIRFHDNNITSSKDDSNVILRRLTKFTSHPKYNHPYSYFDISIITMDNEVNFSEKVRPICLPETHAEVDNRKNDLVTLIGYGTDKRNSLTIDGRLQIVGLNIYAQRY